MFENILRRTKYPTSCLVPFDGGRGGNPPPPALATVRSEAHGSRSGLLRSPASSEHAIWHVPRIAFDSHTPHNRKEPGKKPGSFRWWARRESNPRPAGCKPDALTPELRTLVVVGLQLPCSGSARTLQLPSASSSSLQIRTRPFGPAFLICRGSLIAKRRRRRIAGQAREGNNAMMTARQPSFSSTEPGSRLRVGIPLNHF